MTSEQILDTIVAGLDTLTHLEALTDREGPTLRAIAEALGEPGEELAADTFHRLLLEPLAFYPVRPKLVNSLVNAIARRIVQSAFDRHRISAAKRPLFVAHLFNSGKVPAEFLAKLNSGRYRACLQDVLNSDVWQFAGCTDDEATLAQAEHLLRPRLRLVG